MSEFLNYEVCTWVEFTWACGLLWAATMSVGMIEVVLMLRKLTAPEPEVRKSEPEHP